MAKSKAEKPKGKTSRNKVPRMKICLSLDAEILSLLRYIGNQNSWTMSGLVETLLICGLRNSKLFDEDGDKNE